MGIQISGHIGILGGTFNPIHNGHIELGVQALSQYNLDKVLVMPNSIPDYKEVSSEISSDHRVNMIKLAISDFTGLEYSDFELKRSGITYTSETLEALHMLYPDVHWYFIMGGDSVMYFDKWHRPDVITKLATLLVTTRCDTSLENIMRKIADLMKIYPYADIRTETIRDFNISSTQIRENVKQGISIEEYVPENVRDYILQNNLYK